MSAMEVVNVWNCPHRLSKTTLSVPRNKNKLNKNKLCRLPTLLGQEAQVYQSHMSISKYKNEDCKKDISLSDCKENLRHGTGSKARAFGHGLVLRFLHLPSSCVLMVSRTVG